MKRKLLYGVFIILIIGLLSACNDDEEADEKEEEEAIPVETTEVEKGNLTIDKVVYGRTEPKSTSPIMLQTPGEIDELKVANGDEVEKDEVIARVKTPAGIQDIKAPKKGEVMKLEVSEGSMASDSDPVAIVADLSEMNVGLTVTAEVRKLFEKDKEVTIMDEDEELEGEISNIDSMPDDTGLYPITVYVENEDDKLIPGMVVSLTIPEKRVKDAFILPTEAIVEDSDGAFVYVVEDNKAKKQEITIKESQSDKTAIEGEIEEGDVIVINGSLTLTDGAELDVVDEEKENES